MAAAKHASGLKCAAIPMTPERWKRTEELYHAAGALPSSERAAFLSEACPDDEELRRDVESDRKSVV